MKRNVQIQALIAVLAAGLMFSSCGNIDIIKRKYRPGFHVDISKKRQKTEVAEAAKVAESRNTEELKSLDSKEVTKVEISDDENVLSASTDAAPIFTSNAEKKTNLKEVFRTPGFKDLSFERKMKAIEREIMKPTNAAGADWMKWVSFGTGIGSLFFGALALIFSILTITFYSAFVWPAIVLALLLGGAAITFAILHKKNNGASSQSRLGFVFGIIGAGLAVLSIILWAVFFTIFVL